MPQSPAPRPSIAPLLFLSSFPPPPPLLLLLLLLLLLCIIANPYSSRRMEEVAATKGQVPEMDESHAMLRKRKVIEHVALFQMKKDFTDEQEKDMLDHLYTLQYQMRGIIAVSLGRISNENSDGCTQALFMRFPSAEALKEYYDSPIRWRIANEYIIPHYNGLICVDYETEVEDDIVPIFRRGEDFERGVEFLVLIQVKEGMGPDMVHKAFQAFSGLVEELGSLVVQHTSGKNFCSLNKGYTHGMVTRFPSEEAKEIFTEHPSYHEIFNKKFLPISNKILSLGFSIMPIGTTAL